MSYKILLGDCLQTLRTLPAGSVQTCVTSPPYYGLRDYGTATWEGGAPDCDHVEMAVGMSDKNTLGHNGYLPQSNAANVGRVKQYRDLCRKCGAHRIDNQIGLEPDPESYVAKLVDVFREVRRVLRDDGTVWLNLACSYNGSGGAGGDYGPGGLKEGQPKYPGRNLSNFKPKDMIPIPWMVAMALQQDGYYLRSDIIWAKPNPMPESCRDRPTKAHEYIFLLSKSQTYFYDADAIREPNVDDEKTFYAKLIKQPHKATADDPDLNGLHRTKGGLHKATFNPNGRNRRSVWTVTTKPYAGAHFATFPPDLIEPCILAGTSSHGCCAECGAPWARVVERTREHGLAATSFPKTDGLDQQNGHKRLHQRIKAARAAGEPHDNPLGGTVTTGWQPTCTCGCTDVVPCTVLDPFCGSGTTLAVALKHGRRGIGCELNPDYLELAHKRIGQSQPMLLEVQP